MDFSQLNITVIGLGAIGGSYAMALKKYINPKNLWAVDIDQEVLAKGRAMKIIHEGFLKAEQPLAESDIVFTCLYPAASIPFVLNNINNFKSGTIIIDSAGIKSPLFANLRSISRADIDFINGHPLAGREYKGLEFASAQIFQGANYILVPAAINKPHNLNIIKDLHRRIGFKNIIVMGPGEHDEMIAFISHLPHIIAAALVSNSMASKKKIYPGSSFLDATRVANVNCDLWTELLLGSEKYITKHVDALIDDLEKFKATIQSRRADDLKNLLASARAIKEDLL